MQWGGKKKGRNGERERQNWKRPKEEDTLKEKKKEKKKKQGEGRRKGNEKNGWKKRKGQLNC